MEKLKLTFKKVDGTLITDVEKYVKNWIVKNPNGSIIIGCDSQVHGRRIKYSTVIAMHYVDECGCGHGAHILVADNWEKRMQKMPLDEMPSKLWKETEYVLLAAQMVDGSDETFKKRITIHLDYSNDEKNKSNIMFAAGIGYLSGLGYHAQGKPNSTIASNVADHFVR
jgi:predicted RNase H-related nuclease YkuK (DUF458 family)